MPCSPAHREPNEATLGKLVSLVGVRRYPSRIKCALLGWHALMHAIADHASHTDGEASPPHRRHRESAMNRRPREDVLVRRTVTVEAIPSGAPIELQAGQLAQITQALGGRSRCWWRASSRGSGGTDADAIGKTPPQAAPVPTEVHDADVEPWWERCAPVTTRRFRSTS